MGMINENGDFPGWKRNDGSWRNLKEESKWPVQSSRLISIWDDADLLSLAAEQFEKGLQNNRPDTSSDESFSANDFSGLS